MLDNTSKWSHPRGNTVVPSRWQATALSDESLVEWQETSKRDPRAVWALT